MGHRLSKIYTRTGDDGDTGLGLSQRIGKDSLRIAAIGDIDELNASIGFLVQAMPADHPDQNRLSQIQHDLFDLGGELAMPGHELLDEVLVTELETDIDRINADLPLLKEFILPGGSEAAARAHLSRTVCRRAERSLVAFNRSEQPGHRLAQQYLNRLSDWLFVFSRQLARAEGGSEVLWQSRHKR